MHPRRVVITGMGAVTPLGHSVERFYAAACAGQNGVAPITHFDARKFPTGFAAAVFFRHGLEHFNAARESELEMHTAPAHLAETFDLQGPNYNCLTACAASSQAIGEATALIRVGDADVMLSGGAHSMIHPLGVT